MEASPRRDPAYTYDEYGEKYYSALIASESLRSHLWRCRWLEEALQPSAGDRIVDLGCGAGLVAKFLLSRGATVHGVDLAEGAIQAARRLNATQASGSFRQGDAGDCRHLRSESFDKACSVDVTEHCGYDIMLEIFGEAHRLLRPGGLYFVYTPNPRHWIERLKDWGILQQDPTHTGLRRTATISSALESRGFEIVKSYEPTSMIPYVQCLERLWSDATRERVDLDMDRSAV
jgi:2-polyprenyl-3-methyl-5-hydroxy-6-metoxy-1,4-benzoquinol methylase